MEVSISLQSSQTCLKLSGGFETGNASPYPGNALVNRSLALGEPVIYVSVNYRINGMQRRDIEILSYPLFYLAFGFLGGKEVKEKGLTNVGLHDRKCPWLS